MSRYNNRWFMLAIICLYVFANFLVFQAFPPILSLLIKDLGLSHAEAGLLVAIFSLPGVFLVIPLSFYSTRIGMKRLGIISIALLAAGSIVTATANSFALLLLGRLIAGFGAVALPFAGMEAVAQWFTGHRTGFAMGIYSTCMLGAVIVTLSSFGTVGLTWGWQASIWITVAVCIITLIIYTIFFRKPVIHEDKIEIKEFSLQKSLFKIGWPIWILGICWGVFNVANVSVTTFSPDFMYQNGFDLGVAGFYTSIILMVTVVLSPFVGHLLDRMKYKEILNLIGAVLCFFLGFLLPININIVLLFMFALGIATTPFASVTYATVPTLVKPQMLGAGYAIITTICNLGFVIGPYLTGFIRDATGSYVYSYWVIAVIYLLVILTAASLIFQYRRNKAAISNSN